MNLEFEIRLQLFAENDLKHILVSQDIFMPNHLRHVIAKKHR